MIVQNSNLTLKIVVIGPQRVGKTVLTNSLGDYLNIVPPEYKPTVGCRILEVEKSFTDDQVKNLKILKTNNANKCKIQLWEVSGDKKYDFTWPAIKLDMNGVIVVIDSKSSKYDNVLDEWINGFCPDFSLDNMVCFSSSKEEESKADMKQKISNQFPKLQITEVVNDYNVLLPHFNKFITKLLSNMMP